MAATSTEDPTSSRHTPASIAFTRSTFVTDDLSDLENVSANWTFDDSEDGRGYASGMDSAQSFSTGGCEAANFVEDESKRRLQFKGRHIQMMAFGTAAISIANGRCRRRNWVTLPVRSGTVFCRPSVFVCSIYCDGYRVIFCIGNPAPFWFMSRLPWGK